MNIILQRRSIRKYTNQEISDVNLKMIFQAAMNAPSAGNEQPWEFILIKDKEILGKIAAALPYGRMLASSPVAITVCGNLKRQIYGKDYWIMDCSAATENILLSATELGIGSVWLAVYPENERQEFMKKILFIPDYIIPLAIVALGYPDEKKKPRDRFCEDRIHINKW